MNRDYFSSAYMQLTELQPAPQYHQHHFNMAQASSSATPYNMTAGGSEAGGNGPPVSTLPPAQHQQHHDPRKRRVSNFCEDYDTIAMPGREPQTTAPPANELMPAPASRKRKASSFGTGSTYDDEKAETRSRRTLPDKKQNHSEIEKRRRDKMNAYISELSAIVPMCGAMSRKLDKLTVLRMAVQHLRNVCGALVSSPLTASPRPSYITERELNDLVLAAGHDAFVLVVSCDRGRLLYVSASVTKMLLYEKSDLLGQCLFDILHPKDVAKVKEQLSSSDLNPRERLIDAKTMLPVKRKKPGNNVTRLCTGARRSFFCRIKTKAIAELAEPGLKDEVEPATKLCKKPERKYCVVQCTGYLKSWSSTEISEGGESASGEGGEEEVINMSCLVAVGRALPDLLPPPALPAKPGRPRPVMRKLQFLSRHTNDGKYLFVDQRVTLALGYLPQELLGTSMYELVSGPQLGALAAAHRAALVRRVCINTVPYEVRCKNGELAVLQTGFKPFRNPWTKDMESLVAEHTLLEELPPAEEPAHSGEGSKSSGGGASSAAECDAEVQRLIESHVETHKIGSAIAEEALRRSPASLTLDQPAELLLNPDALLFNPALVDTILADDSPLLAHQEREGSPAGGGAEGGAEGGPGSPVSLTLDGNSEAAMAVIMSLLEADAGLGGPVNFSGLPWPLP